MARPLVDDRETAEDVVMDAFTSLYRRWAAIRDPAEAHRDVRSCVLNGARNQNAAFMLQFVSLTTVRRSLSHAGELAVNQDPTEPEGNGPGLCATGIHTRQSVQLSSTSARTTTACQPST